MKTSYSLLYLLLTGFFLNSSCSNKSQSHNELIGFSVHWRYKVKPENMRTFEFEYGPNGTWYKLFNQSEDYKGSFLGRSNEDSIVYILIDTWASRESYESFKEKYKEDYQKLSGRFESLYISEEKLGSFNSVE